MGKLNLEVWTVPLGASLREQFCAALKKLLYGTGVLVLPTGLLQKHVQEKYNVQVSGFDTLANKILNLNGYAYLDAVNYRSQQLLVEQAVAYCVEQGKLPYLARLQAKPGFVKHMTTLLTQLSRSGATVAQITTALNEWGRQGNLRLKDRDVTEVYTVYRMLLKMQNRFDLEGKYRLALKILREQEQPRLPWQVIYLSDFATLDALQLELLLALAKHCMVKVGMCYEGEQSVCAVSQTTLERLAQAVKVLPASGIQGERGEDLQHLVENLGRVQAPKVALSAQPQVELREYTNQQTELAGVFTDIKAQLLAGAKLQNFAVAVYDLNNYNGLRQLADEYGIPLTMPQTELLGGQPLTEFLQTMLAAVADTRTGVEAYFALLTSALGKLLFADSLENCHKLREDTYFTLRSSVQMAVGKWLEAKTKPLLLTQIDTFLEQCPRKATVPEYTQCLTDFLQALQLPQQLGALYKQGGLALAGLQNYLQTEQLLQDNLRALADDYTKCDLAQQKYALDEFCQLWQESLKDASIITAKARQDGLLVTNAVQLQGLSFKKVYVLGLREGEFPAGNRENWLYNDQERGELQSLGLGLPTTYSAYASDAAVFAGVVAVATEKLVLSYYKDDEGEASPYVDAVQGLFTNLEVTRVEDKPLASLQEALAKSSYCEPAWLEQQVGKEVLTAARIDLQRIASTNGILENEDLLKTLQERLGHKFSATALANYVSCPFKYLGMELWREQGSTEKSEQLDGGTRGSLFHDTVAKFVATYVQGKPASYEAAAMWPQLKAIYQREVAEYIEQGKIYANEFWPSESARLERTLAWWLAYELTEQQQWSNFKPLALEKNFGSRDLTVRLETQAQVPVLLKGRVDRIDGNDTQAFVTDYKTGAAPGENEFKQGTDLQMAFYLLAAEKICRDKEVLGGDYLSLKKQQRLGGVAWKATGNSNIKVAGKKNAPTYTSWEEVKQACLTMILEPVEALYAGNFAVRPRDKDACTYCPLKDICRQNVVTQGKPVQEQQANGQEVYKHE